MRSLSPAAVNALRMLPLMVGASALLGGTGCGGPPLTPPAQPGHLDCSRAARILADDRRSTLEGYRWALVNMYDCPQGGAIVGHLWSAPPADTARLSSLAGVSAHLHDHRLFTQTLALVADTARPLPARLAAAQVLTSYWDSTLRAKLELQDASPAAPIFVAVVTSSHTFTRHGPQPLQEDA